MSDKLPNKVSLSKAKRMFTNRKDIYTTMSQVYKLPEFTSRAITKNYLQECMKENCAFFRIKHQDFHPPFIPVKHTTAPELLEAVEELLQKKNLPPTGLYKETLPDYAWLLGVYFFLDKNDELGLFPHSIKPEAHVELNIDPEILKVAENSEFKFGRSILNLGQEDAMAYKKKRLQRQIKRQSQMQKELEEKIQFSKRMEQKFIKELEELEDFEENEETEGEDDDSVKTEEPSLKKKIKTLNQSPTVASCDVDEIFEEDPPL